MCVYIHIRVCMYVYIYIYIITYITPKNAEREREGESIIEYLSIHVCVCHTKNMVPVFLVGGFNPSEKYESQLGLLFPIYGKIKFMFQTNNQYLGYGHPTVLGNRYDGHYNSYYLMVARPSPDTGKSKKSYFDHGTYTGYVMIRSN